MKIIFPNLKQLIIQFNNYSNFIYSRLMIPFKKLNKQSLYNYGLS